MVKRNVKEQLVNCAKIMSFNQSTGISEGKQFGAPYVVNCRSWNSHRKLLVRGYLVKRPLSLISSSGIH